jgi:membrane protein DedA with SNARE-associated domain
VSGSRTSSPRRTVVAVALIIAAVAAVGSVVGGMIDPASWLFDAIDSLGAWMYVVVAAFAFLETGGFVGLLVPGETAVIVGGVAAGRGQIDLAPFIALVGTAALCGDITGFLLGRRLGEPFLDKQGARLGIRKQDAARVNQFFARHGGRAVLIGRFIGLVRPLIPFVAGASGLRLRRLLPFSAAGAFGWTATFAVVGYEFSDTFESSGKEASLIAMGGAVLLVGVLALIDRVGHPGGPLPEPGPGG